MSKEKISIPEIVDMMVQNRNLTKKSAEDFVRILLSTIEDTLIDGEIVKIKGLGTFKPQWNEARKSVDVNTGNEIVIDGYYKVSFIPDNELKDLINQPFAHLEPVELPDEEKQEEVAEIVTVETEKPEMEPLRSFEEQATEIKSILSEIEAMSGKKAAEKEPVKILEDKPIITESEADNQELIESKPETEEKKAVDEIADEDVDEVMETDKDSNKDKKHKKERGKEFDLSDFDVVRVVGAATATAVTSEPVEPVVATVPEVPVIQTEIPEKVEETEEAEESEKSEEPLKEDIQEEPIRTVWEIIDDTAPLKTPETEVLAAEKLDEKEVVENENENNVGVTDDDAAVEKLTSEEPTTTLPPVTDNPLDLEEEPRKRYTWLYVLIPLLILSALAAWYYMTKQAEKEQTIKRQIRLEQIADSIAKSMKDTVVQPADTLKTDTVAATAQPVVDPFAEPRTYTEFIATEPMKQGSQLSRFAKKYFGHAYFWVYIYEANKDQIADPDNVPLGLQVKIPKVNPELIDTGNKKCLDYALSLANKYMK